MCSEKRRCTSKSLSKLYPVTICDSQALGACPHIKMFCLSMIDMLFVALTTLPQTINGELSKLCSINQVEVLCEVIVKDLQYMPISELCCLSKTILI